MKPETEKQLLADVKAIKDFLLGNDFQEGFKNKVEKRLHKLENWQQEKNSLLLKIYGGAVVVSVIVSFILGIIFK